MEKHLYKIRQDDNKCIILQHDKLMSGTAFGHKCRSIERAYEALGESNVSLEDIARALVKKYGFFYGQVEYIVTYTKSSDYPMGIFPEEGED